VQPEQLTLQVHRYTTDLTDEHFLQFVTNACVHRAGADRRLSAPQPAAQDL
jgi:hypothetical protein